MEGMLPTLTTVFLMLALGVRHGLDPEHIAIVNSVALRAAETGRRRPALSGLYFALGHGLVITAVAMGVTELLGLGHLPAWLEVLGAWLPMGILFLVATLNLRELLRPDTSYQPSNVKAKLLPAALRNSAHPLAVFLIGMLFAPFVDPATQTAVWGYAVGTSAGIAQITILGLLLTASLAATCVLEARGMLMLMQGGDDHRAERRRRALGWFIVVFSYGIVIYAIADRLLPALGFQAALTSGATLTGVIVLTILALLRRQRRRAS